MQTLSHLINNYKIIFCNNELRVAFDINYTKNGKQTIKQIIVCNKLTKLLCLPKDYILKNTSIYPNKVEHEFCKLLPKDTNLIINYFYLEVSGES